MDFTCELPATGKDIRKHLFEVHGLNTKTSEQRKNAYPCVYIERCTLEDAETGFVSIGHPKIGSALYLTPLARGRDASGAINIWEFVYQCATIKEANKLEKYIQDSLVEYNYDPGQGQKEMFKLPLAICISKVEALIQQFYGNLAAA